MRKRGEDAAQFRKPLEAADGGIAGLSAAVEVVENVMAMIRTERNRPVGAAFRLAPSLLAQSSCDDGDHIGVAAEMLCFVKGTADAARLAFDVAQMEEVHARTASCPAGRCRAAPRASPCRA